MSQDEVEEESNDGRMVRSLSMSRNMALSVVDEVSHMIKLLPTDTPPADKKSWWRPSSPKATRLKRSSSASSLQTKMYPEDKENSASVAPESMYVKYGNTNKGISRRGSEGLAISPRPVYDPNETIVPTTTQSNSLNRISTTKSVQQNANVKTQFNIPPIVKGVRRNDVLVGIVVSRWDNIVGPQSVYMWTEELTSVFYPARLPPELSRLVKYVTDHTVDHQTTTAGYIHPTVQRTTLCIVSDLNLAYLSLQIRVPTELDTILEFQTSAPMTANNPDNPALTMPHSISVLCNLKYIDKFLLLRPLLNSWLMEFGPQIGVLICKDNLHGSMINSWCAELCKTITALQTCWAQDITELAENASCFDSTIKSSQLQSQPHSKQANLRKTESEINYLPPPNSTISRMLLGTLLTSHLTTFNNSIVVGDSSLAINQIIRFLLCFATSQEGYCSRYLLASLPDTFMKGLYIQGLTLGGIGERSVSAKQVITNRLPLTRIDLGPKVKVRQTSVAAHTQEKEAILMQELHKLWTSSYTVVPTSEAFPTLLKESASIVNQFLKELELLPPERRYGRLLLFKRVIHAKAISLITFLHSIQHKPIKEKTRLKLQIPEILGFDQLEYLIVQVAAEKIRPGTMSHLKP